MLFLRISTRILILNISFYNKLFVWSNFLKKQIHLLTKVKKESNCAWIYLFCLIFFQHE